MVTYPKRFEVFLVALDPTIGSEIKKTRPALIISPDEMNEHLKTVIIAPMTTTDKAYPTRTPITFQKKQGFEVVDQIRTVDKYRLVKKLSKVSTGVEKSVLSILSEMFSG